MRLDDDRGIEIFGIEFFGFDQFIMWDTGVEMHPQRYLAHLVDDIDARDDTAGDRFGNLGIPHREAKYTS